MSVDELYLIAETVRDLCTHESIAVRADDHYWKKFHLLLSGILAVANGEAMEELSSIPDEKHIIIPLCEPLRKTLQICGKKERKPIIDI